MRPFTLIAGPCLIEDEEVALHIATYVKELCAELDMEYVFKGSFKKANRTSIDSKMGIGDEDALKILARVGKELDLKTLTDIHESHEADLAAEYVDVLQIPAFLCRQTELLLAAGRTGKVVNIKKGQFLSPEAMRFPKEKVESTGNHQVWLTERGTTFGYNELIVDATAIARLKELQSKVIMDCTHATQKPNRTQGTTGGDPSMIGTLALSAVATGADGLFIETHPDPATAGSDSATMLQMDALRSLLIKVNKVRSAGI
ncbi:MAG: 3-deoxy-8-phosphooctulonate synthase [Flavobacteriales bacterium]|nr:3-deoxy-8-phosphooctulonate synthase [Flavobacteriales bacterium]